MLHVLYLCQVVVNILWTLPRSVTCYMYSTSVRQSWSSYGHFLGVSHVTCTLPLLGSREHLMNTSQECHILHVLYLCQVVVVILWTLPRSVTCYMYFTSVRQSWSSYGHFLGVSHVTCTLPLLGSRGHLMDTSQECHMLHVLYPCQVVVVILWTLPRSVTCTLPLLGSRGYLMDTSQAIKL